MKFYVVRHGQTDISSPLKRARKTAEIINKTVKCNIIFEDSLKERGYGIFEGFSRYACRL